MALFPGTLGTLFGTYSNNEVALAAIEKHKKEQEVRDKKIMAKVPDFKKVAEVLD